MRKSTHNTQSRKKITCPDPTATAVRVIKPLASSGYVEDVKLDVYSVIHPDFHGLNYREKYTWDLHKIVALMTIISVKETP